MIFNKLKFYFEKPLGLVILCSNTVNILNISANKLANFSDEFDTEVTIVEIGTAYVVE